jgi:predicted DNA-binding transcriptional regulator AlpA
MPNYAPGFAIRGDYSRRHVGQYAWGPLALSLRFRGLACGSVKALLRADEALRGRGRRSLKGNLLIQNNEQSTLIRDLARSGISVTDPTTRTPAMNEGPTSAFDELLPPPPAAKALNVSLSWLAKARLRGDGPRYVKIGRSVRYPKSYIREYLLARTRNSTSE